MIPLPLILAELIMALGAALFGANVYALVRPRLRPDDDSAPEVEAKGRVLVMATIGLVVFLWGLASFVTRI